MNARRKLYVTLALSLTLLALAVGILLYLESDEPSREEDIRHEILTR